ncbi:hypothetical protein [Bacillus sp. REN3]|uniref:UPF0738 family protein n=1 Tax=Bacillus sp. REN3 TaxID=2802440 RepID=UPI001FF071B4|nr:hypothetical protein [Bacillus sp. REN3]
MSQRIEINDATIKNNELLLTADLEAGIEEMTATGQMLVDSDQLSFIYIVEKEGGYQYLSIPERIWDIIHDGLQAGLEASLISGRNKLRLPGFRQEMDYLIANITGNSNYGEEMVAKVEQIFAAPSA